MGKVHVLDGELSFTPAGFADYGHGRDVQVIRNVSGCLELEDIAGCNFSDVQALRVSARASGVSPGQGRISLKASSDLREFFRPASDEAPLVRLELTGRRISSRAVGAFLNLPLRSDTGRVGGKIFLVFKAGQNLPEMEGDVTLDGVTLKFHPNPS